MLARNRRRDLRAFTYAGLVLIPAVWLGIALNSGIATRPEVAIGITYDLTLTLPLLYLLLIWRTRVPKTTVVPVFVIGVVLATRVVPAEHQFHLGLIKTWLLPVVELTVLSVLGYSVFKTVRELGHERNRNSDVLENLHTVCRRAFEVPILANAVAFEMAVIYYGFVSWTRSAPSPRAFTYHANSGKTALFLALIFIVAIEMLVLHVLVARWSEIAAWVLTVASGYVLIQLFAHVKAMYQRPIEIVGDRLLVRYGLFGGADIAIDNIAAVTLTSTSPPKGDGVIQAALFAELEYINVQIDLIEPESFSKIYGMREEFRTLLLFVDEPNAFRDALIG